jgi:hypothetical protein
MPDHAPTNYESGSWRRPGGRQRVSPFWGALVGGLTMLGAIVYLAIALSHALVENDSRHRASQVDRAAIHRYVDSLQAYVDEGRQDRRDLHRQLDRLRERFEELTGEPGEAERP